MYSELCTIEIEMLEMLSKFLKVQHGCILVMLEINVVKKLYKNLSNMLNDWKHNFFFFLGH